MFNEEVMNIDIYTKRNSNSQEKPTNFLSLRGIGWEDKNFVRDSFKDFKTLYVQNVLSTEKKYLKTPVLKLM